MSTRCHLSSFHVCLCLLAVAMLSGCASRKIVTAVEDQSFLPGPAPQVQAPVDEAKVPPPTPPPSTPMEAARAEPAPVQPAPVQVEKPAVSPAVKEALVVEQPITQAPPSQPQAPAAILVPEPSLAPELSDVFFDFDRFSIRDEARSGLEADAGLLKSKSGEKVLIEGHCDERGTSAYNLVLGERRAQAVAQYLRDLGVPSSQMQITSYGKERPFCTEHSEACWQSNRRAHFTK